MLNRLTKCVFQHSLSSFSTGVIRTMTTTEVSTALRPFYFSVHPDLFEQHPDKRTTNENSLKQLSSVIETLQSKRPVNPCNLQFYLRDKRKDGVGTFRLIKIYLQERNIRDVVLTVLKSCQLSTDYVDKIPPNQTDTKPIEFKMRPKPDFTTMDEFDPIFGPLIRQHIKKSQEAFTLRKWLHKNHQNAIDITESHKPLREEVARLKAHIEKQYGIVEVRWDCGWNETHFRGCLKSFQSLADQHTKSMHILRGRILVFAPFTGVSLDGHIMLYSGEVRHNWLDLIKNVKKYDASLLRIPAFEKAVSQVLRGMRISRRKFMPKILAGEYEKHLQKVTTSLSDYLGRGDYPKHWPSSLAKFEMVVETEAGPLMVSPTGQFIVPASCPGFLLVNFINDNMEEALQKMDNYKRNKHIEKSLHKQCLEVIKTSALHKDDNVTPDMMIECLQRLLSNSKYLNYLEGINLNITNYYSVLSDGVVCIPWNWKL